MLRREFLALSLAGFTLSAGDLWLPIKKIFLPPVCGWPVSDRDSAIAFQLVNGIARDLMRDSQVDLFGEAQVRSWDEQSYRTRSYLARVDPIRWGPGGAALECQLTQEVVR